MTTFVTFLLGIAAFKALSRLFDDKDGEAIAWILIFAVIMIVRAVAT